jgi:phospholipase C
LAGLSLRQLAVSLRSNTLAGMATNLTVSWPPPISLRNLILVTSGVIKHIFVLVFENRSFDHLLGFSNIWGQDSVTHQPTRINGLGGGEDNIFNGISYTVSQPADYALSIDPNHEFPNVLVQLCGVGSTYSSGGSYPSIFNSGFVASYVASGGGGAPGEVMKCFSPYQLPVLNSVAEEFVICDNWHASLPGPTWPNRFFVHGASSAGLDHSPSLKDVVIWEGLSGFDFKNGTVFDQLQASKLEWRIYAGDDFPTAAALKGVSVTDAHDYGNFAQDVSSSQYPAAYTFIEPSYNVLSDYKCSNSQHPLDDVTRGEMLLKHTYEALRSSPLWESSLLVITWDEHGGFYDHVAPPAAVPPGDTKPNNDNSQFGFGFDRYGPRVPCVIVSPRIPRNLIDHRMYDHSSIPALLEACFGLKPMTERDAQANNPIRLLSLATPRDDAPTTLPSPAQSGVPGCDDDSGLGILAVRKPVIARPADQIDEGNLPGILHAALRSDLELSPPDQRDAIIARVGAMKTRAEAWSYIGEVEQKIRTARIALGSK